MRGILFTFIFILSTINSNGQCDSLKVALKLKTKQYRLLSDYPEKAEYLKQSIAYFINCNFHEAAIDWQTSLVKIAKNEHDIREYFKSIQILDQLIIKHEQNISPEFRLKMQFRSLFYWFEFYFNCGQESKAITYVTAIDSLYLSEIEVLPSITRALIANIYRSIWDYYYSKNEITTSLYFLDKSMNVCQQMKNVENKLIIENQLLSLYTLFYLNVGDQKNAKTSCIKFIKKANELINYGNRYKGYVYTANSRFAEWHINNNSLDSALYFNSQYTQLLKKYNSSLFFSDIQRAKIFNKKSDLKTANIILRDLIQNEGGRNKMIENRNLKNCLEVIDLLIQSEDYENAIVFQDSINNHIVRKMQFFKGKEIPIFNSNQKHLLDLLMSKLRLPKSHLDLDLKLQLLEEAYSLVGDGLSKISNNQDKIFFSRISSMLTNELFESVNLNETEHQEFSFSAIERSKAATLINSWKQKQLISFSNNENIFMKEESLQNDLKLLSIKFLEESDSSSIIELTNKIRSKKNILDSIKLELKSSHLTYYKMKYDWQNPEIQDLHKVLQEDEVYINYFEGENSLYAMLISLEKNKIIRIEAHDSIKSLIQQYSSSLFKHSDEEAAQEIDKISFLLYEHLLSPFEDELKDRIIISPSGSLSKIPFSALRQNNDPGNAAMLLNQHSLSYTPSASLFYQERISEKDHKINNSLLVAPKFGPVEMSEEILAMRSSHGELIFNTQEVDAISPYLKNESLMSDFATKDNFLSSLEDMDIVHLATHANSNSDAPDKSYIAFYEEEDQLEEDENLLYLDDLSKLYMPAKMVVLSACETGLGKIFKGEGAMSLANACFYAGAQSVVATLWSVQDNTTYEIIVSFYDYLQKGYSKDKALQAAQLDFINSHSKDFHHPYYWAGFTVIGNNEPLVFAKSNPLQKYGSIGLISITLIFAVNFYRNRKKSAKEAA